MRTSESVLVLAVVSILAACQAPKQMVVDSKHFDEVAIGVALVHPPSDVADLTASVEHVLNPRNTATQKSPAASVATTPQKVSSSIAVFRASPATEIIPAPARLASNSIGAPASIQLPQPPLPSSLVGKELTSEEKAWSKFCNQAEGLKSLRPSDWQVINATTMPESIRKLYPECESGS
jgi:hypothetical protein